MYYVPCYSIRRGEAVQEAEGLHIKDSLHWHDTGQDVQSRDSRSVWQTQYGAKGGVVEDLQRVFMITFKVQGLQSIRGPWSHIRIVQVDGGWNGETI